MKSFQFSDDFKDDVKNIAKLAAPVFLANVCNIGTAVSDNMFLGHLGSEAFAAAAISIVYTAATIWIGIGLAFGMDTLVSQSFGAGNYELVGIVTQNALLVVTVAAFPIAVLWLVSENFMLLLGIEPAIAAKTGLFTMYLIPGLLPYLYYYVMQRYLTNQNIIMPSLVVGAIGFFLNIIFNYLFIYVFGLGFIGSPIATSCSRFVLPIAMFAIIKYKGLHKRTWFGWSREMFDRKRLATYLKFGVSGGLMVLLEVIGFELTTLTASLLVTPIELNAHSIGFNSLLVSFTVPLSISIATSTRVGQFLGEGKPERAKGNGKTGGYVVFVVMFLNGFLIFIFRDYFGRLYTDDSRVLAIAPKVLMFSAAAAFMDGIQAFLGGIMRGAGTPHAGTVMNLFGYYVVGGVSYYVFGYVLGWGVYGVWTGLLLALSVVCIGSAFFVLRIDWKKESLNAQKRSEKGGIELDSLIVEEAEEEAKPKKTEEEEESTEQDSLVSHSTSE